jgi:pyrroline-5-carboxylate reductase
LIISIAAGITEPDLRNWLGGDLAIIRCMPNTPALIGCGATGLFANSFVNKDQRQIADAILSAAGITVWVDDEKLLDSVTALSGSGPAYFFLVIEILQKIGEELGLTPEQARQLTLQTAVGATRMAQQSDESAAVLRKRVTSPGGTTERAIEILQSGGIEKLFSKALTGAYTRCEELSDLLGGRT